MTLRRFVAVLLFVAWLPQFAALWPGPWEQPPEDIRRQFSEAARNAARFPDLESASADRAMFEEIAHDPQPLLLWAYKGWALHLALVAFGVTAGILAWIGAGLWRWIVAGTSVAYFWLFSWPTSLSLLSDPAVSFGGVLGRISVLASQPLFFHANLLVPPILLGALVLLLVEIARTRNADRRRRG